MPENPVGSTMRSCRPSATSASSKTAAGSATGRRASIRTPSMFCPPHDGKPATAGNGTMIAFVAPSKDAVQSAYEAGLARGGTDEGAPGPRPADSTTFYGCYLRDPAGNKICVFAKGRF